MSDVFFIKRNDTGPAIAATLYDADGDVVDLTSASVRFHMRLKGASTTKVDAAGSVTGTSAGEVQYAWLAGDTDTAGTYEAEFEITFADGSVETFPNNGNITVVVRGDIS